MNESDQNAYDRLAAFYTSGIVPWDEKDPPPEVISFISSVPAGTALDLGCGYGRASIYMALHGWTVDAVDFIPEAIAEAAKRAAKAHAYVRFHLSKVTDLDFFRGSYDFALDVGCSHSLLTGELQVYRDQLRRLIHVGGIFLLFARLQDDSGGEDNQAGPPGLELQAIQALYSEGFKLEWMESGQTDVGDQGGWSSAWFRFRRI